MTTDLQWTEAPPDVPRLDSATLDQLLSWATAAGASDVVLRTGEPPIARIHGAYRRLSSRRISYAEAGELLNAMYMPSAMARVLGGDPVDFHYAIRCSRSARLGFRVNATGVSPMSGSGAHGLEIVMRTIPSAPPTVGSLDVEPEILEACDQSGSGLILVTGPTGSGKTTLLASLLRRVLTDTPRHVVTYEAPIEFDLGRVPGMKGLVAQSEVPRHVEGFAAGVANALRRAPDVILVGEARDQETISGVVTASQTGHQVYSTVHTNDVASTVPRMVDAFPAAERDGMAMKIVDALRLVVHQRLVPAAAGGRAALREYLVYTPDLRRELMNAVSKGDLQERTREAVMTRGFSLSRHALRKAAEGVIEHSVASAIVREYGGQVA